MSSILTSGCISGDEVEFIHSYRTIFNSDPKRVIRRGVVFGKSFKYAFSTENSYNVVHNGSIYIVGECDMQKYIEKK